MKSNGLLSCQFDKMQYNRIISVIFCGLGLGGLGRARASMIIPAFPVLKMNCDVHGFVNRLDLGRTHLGLLRVVGCTHLGLVRIVGDELECPHPV